LYPRLEQAALKDRAVRLAGAAGDATSERWLRGLVEDAREPAAARDRAIRLLAEQGDYAALRAAYARLGETALKDRILRVLAETGGADNLQFVRRVVVNGAEASTLRERALRVLVQMGMTTTELAALYDSLADRQLKGRAINLLAERGGDAALDKLARIAREDPDLDLRRQAVRRLAQSGDPRAQSFFERTLRD
jgi:hypothetical protein